MAAWTLVARPAALILRASEPETGLHYREPRQRGTVCHDDQAIILIAWRTTELNMTSAADRDPRHHTQKMQKALQDLQTHLREDIEKVNEPQLKAMFETSAEVLGGLCKAFRDYERKTEAAWRT